MAKAKTPTDEKFTDVDFELFPALEAIDRKDYGYYDRLTEEQRKKFSAYMMLLWTSAVTGNHHAAYLHNINLINKYYFDDAVQKNPKLQWLLLCAASPNKGKLFHQYIPSIETKVVKLKKKAILSEIKEYFKKIHPNVDPALIDEMAKTYTEQQHKKLYLAERFPYLKFDEIDLLHELVTDEEIAEYERAYGN